MPDETILVRIARIEKREYTLADRERQNLDFYEKHLDELPPVEIRVWGHRVVLIDGFHRVCAAIKLGRTHVRARIVQTGGTHSAQRRNTYRR